MNLLLPWQAPDLAAWEARPVATGISRGAPPSAARDAYRRVIARERPGPPEENGPYAGVARAIAGYRVFPDWLIAPVLRRAPVRPGDTVGIFFRPLRLFFAARVSEVIDAPFLAGFTYQTLQGHPEYGEETFAVEKDPQSGNITASLESWSLPGLPLTRLATPLVRWLQRFASEQALRNLERYAGCAAASGPSSE